MPAKLTGAIPYKLENSTKGSRARGQERAAKILQNAQEILANDGYHSLTLRKIAKTMGISNGNVTYYYANKEQLLKAIISDNLARYDAALYRAAINFPDHPKARLKAFFEFLIEDAREPKSQRFFYQLWALASHNKEAALQRDSVYEHYLNQISVHVRPAYPEMTEDELLRKSFMLMSLTEGMNVMYGSGEALKKKFGNQSSWILNRVMEIIEN